MSSPIIRDSFRGTVVEIQEVAVTLDSNGDGTKAITWTNSFAFPPEVTVVGYEFSLADRLAKSITTQGCTVHIGETATVGGTGGTSEEKVSQVVTYIVIAHGKL